MTQPRYRNQDWLYDVSTQDWQVSAGDLVVSNDASTLFSQLLIDAMESTFNSMPYILRNWGYEDRNVSLLTATDVDKHRARLLLSEIMGSLSPFIRNVLAVTIDFPSGTDTLTAHIELVLNDMLGTNYDHTLTWNATTKRAVIV